MPRPGVSDRMGQGYLTLATRHRMYLEMAVDLALSLGAFDERPLSLILDEELYPVARDVYSEVFHRLLLLPEGFAFGRAAKFAVAEVTPYGQNVFIDADTLVLDSPQTSWQDAGVEPIAMMAEYLGRDDARTHHGHRVGDLMERFGLERYFKATSAVFCFEREAARPILRRCFEAYRDRAYPELSWAGDEIGFALVGSTGAIDIMSRPWPILWRHQLETLDPGRPEAPFYTVLGEANEAAMDRLMSDVRRRRSAAGLPTGSEAYWRLKASTSGVASWVKALRPLRRLFVDLRYRFSTP